jgi:hypothetical protein
MQPKIQKPKNCSVCTVQLVVIGIKNHFLRRFKKCYCSLVTKCYVRITENMIDVNIFYIPSDKILFYKITANLGAPNVFFFLGGGRGGDNCVVL